MKTNYNFDYSQLSAFSGYYTDINKLKLSASGGGASAIAEAIIKNNGVVFGVTYSSNFKTAEYICIEQKEDLYKIKGSKYTSTQKRILYNGEYTYVYKIVEEKLNQKRKVLFIGLGCDIAALLAFLAARKTKIYNLYTIDLICHGTTFSQVAKCFVEDLQQKYKSTLTDFSVRYKKEGWVPKYIFAQFANGKQYCVPFNDTEYGYAFARYKTSRCYNCKFKGNNHKADLTLGDYWGINKESYEYNNYGVSLFIVKNNRGKALLDMIDNESFKLQPSSIEFAMKNNKMYYTCCPQIASSDKFESNLNKKGLHYAIVKDYGIIKYLLMKTNFIKLIRKLFR